MLIIYLHMTLFITLHKLISTVFCGDIASWGLCKSKYQKRMLDATREIKKLYNIKSISWIKIRELFTTNLILKRSECKLPITPMVYKWNCKVYSLWTSYLWGLPNLWGQRMWLYILCYGEVWIMHVWYTLLLTSWT